jgi:hypothetical protein
MEMFRDSGKILATITQLRKSTTTEDIFNPSGCVDTSSMTRYTTVFCFEFLGEEMPREANQTPQASSFLRM